MYCITPLNTMKELLQILDRALLFEQEKADYALATVVKIGGSTYRRPGARMLISPEGQRWGTVSGGCLEGEIAAQAIQVLDAGVPRLLPFDLEDDDIVLGFGSGCNGVVHVLIQPVRASDPVSPVDALQWSISNRKRGILATVINAVGIEGSAQNGERVGQFALLGEDGAWGPSTFSETMQRDVFPAAHRLLEAELRQEQTYLWRTHQLSVESDVLEVLLEIVRPPVNLFVFGEGHDVHAVVAQGCLMGWHVHVVGRKPAPELKQRFPDATACHFLMHPEQLDDLLSIDPRSAAIVMNHTFMRDRQIMHHLLHSDIPYIGVLGPRERTEAMLEALQEAGHSYPEHSQARLFGPLGLDIGTETPEEIALSACSEIQAVLHDRQGGSLRRRQGPIHASRVSLEATE